MPSQIDDSEHLENPAGRLFLLLSELSGGDGRRHIVDVLMPYLGLSDRVSPEFFDAIALIADQPQRLMNEVEGLSISPSARDALQREFPRIQATVEILVTNYGSMINVMAGEYDRGTLRTLEAVSRAINSARHSEAESSRVLLADVAAKNSELIEVLTGNLDLEPQLRKLLFDHADAIHRAIDLYVIGGIEVVLAEYDALTGSLYRHAHIVNAAAKNGPLKRSLASLIMALNLVAGVGNAVVAIEDGSKALRSLISAPVVIQAPAEPSDIDPTV